MKEIPKKYDIVPTEEKWLKFWDENKIYDSKVTPGKKKFSVVIPPPNITGILHMGHILNNTIQDIYSRWKRMQGYEVCWVPGTDHAGIATQQVLEKDLAAKGISKYDLGREEFVKAAWEWKRKYGGHILKQLKRMGASVDWSKERFTLDEGLSKAVTEVFVDLYKKGLVYRGKRIVNWDPKSLTAVSDDEIVHKEKVDKLYFVKYKLTDSDNYLVVATTRPETMFGDTAVAVNPDDNRYNSFKNKKVILPLLNKEIPVVADDYVDVEFGTGALKITPAHDVNDFEVGKRHNLEVINVLTKDSNLNEHGMEFAGMDIFKARKLIVEKLQSQGLIEKIEEYTHNVAYGDRSGAVIEPYLSDQWFVSMKPLAEPAIKVLENKEIKFHPEKWEKTYFNWMRNVKDWCISRQLWWGHRIPIWYHNDTGEIYCATEPPKDIENWTQDPDVLDTWFSSWLWPFSVFGWQSPNEDNGKNEQLNYYYPTDFLSTAPEIIYLWVARMIMAGLEYMKEIPFKDVYFHSIVRDGQGRKMSKSLGNSPEPMDLMETYGTDALRFTLVYLAPLGNDVMFDEKSMEIGRNFVTKVWNAGRFLMMNYENVMDSNEYGDEKAEDDLIDKWINSRLNSSLKDIDSNLSGYKLNEYTKSIYSFVWDDFCDWYIELLKIKINQAPSSAKNTIAKAFEMYDAILRILHPVAPFITEELWHLIQEGRETESISKASFPALDPSSIDKAVEKEFNSLKEIVIGIRNLRAESEIPPSKKAKVLIKYDNTESKKILDDFSGYVSSLCNLESLEVCSSVKQVDDMSAKVITGFEIYLMLGGLIDVEKQKEKYRKEISNLQKYLDSLDKKLSNEKFLEKASPQVIESERAKQAEASEKLEKLKAKI